MIGRKSSDTKLGVFFFIKLYLPFLGGSRTLLVHLDVSFPLFTKSHRKHNIKRFRNGVLPTSSTIYSGESSWISQGKKKQKNCNARPGKSRNGVNGLTRIALKIQIKKVFLKLRGDTCEQLIFPSELFNTDCSLDHYKAKRICTSQDINRRDNP